MRRLLSCGLFLLGIPPLLACGAIADAGPLGGEDRTSSHDAGQPGAGATSDAADGANPDDASLDGDAGTRDAGSDAKADAAHEAGPAPLDPTLFDPCVGDFAGDPIFSWANPNPSQLDVGGLRALVKDAEAQKSDALIVAINDTIVAHKCFVPSSPLLPSVQSVTKSVTSLAIGALIDDGKIASLDAPLSDFFPEWTDGARAGITVRHLLTQSSGIVDTILAGGVAELFTVDDALAYARKQVPAYTPGATFAYTNTGVMLLGGIATIAAGMDVATFIDQRFFAPLGIVDAGWNRDKAGHAMTPGGLFMSAMDLLRLARLGRSQGSWQGTSLVSARWIAQSTTPQSVVPYPCYGFLWWMLRDNCNADVGPTGDPGALRGFFADGYGGNYAAVVPSSHVIGVRMKLQSSPDPSVALATDFDAFPGELAGLAP